MVVLSDYSVDLHTYMLGIYNILYIHVIRIGIVYCREYVQHLSGCKLKHHSTPHFIYYHIMCTCNSCVCTHLDMQCRSTCGYEPKGRERLLVGLHE